MKELDENFKGAMLEEKKADLKTAYDTTVATYRNECISVIEPALKAAKRAVIEAASRPIPAGLYESLSAFEGLKMSDMEKEMVLEMTKNSYLARKRAIEILNLPEKELPPSMDDVIGNLETLKKVIMRSLRNRLMPMMCGWLHMVIGLARFTIRLTIFARHMERPKKNNR